jgi:hypothetical protein
VIESLDRRSAATGAAWRADAVQLQVRNKSREFEIRTKPRADEELVRIHAGAA